MIRANIAYEENIRISADDIPNATTHEAINEARKRKGEKFDTLSEVFDELKKSSIGF